MRLNIDAYAGLTSPIHQWLPTMKLMGLVALIFGFATVQQLWLVPYMVAVALGLFWLSQLPGHFLRSRLRYPGLFLLGVVIALPFLSGQTVLWHWGILTLRQEGVLTMLLVAGRFFSIITVGIVLLGTTPFLTLISAMRSLGLPPILADMTLLAYRYLFDISDQLTQLKQAMRLRGFGPTQTRRTWQQLAAVTGTLLIRSYEHSERVYKAMRLRGYGMSSVAPIRHKHWVGSPWGTWQDMAGLASCVAIAMALILAQWI
ncbi:MAG: cobalt ECF transporter T component CbiQ [Cyanobacteria bacterium P01_D01_bin.44]